MLKYITTITPDGNFHMIINDSDIVIGSGFFTIEELVKRCNDSSNIKKIEQTEHIYSSYILDYYKGDKNALNKIPSYQTGTEFQRKVWKALKDIPYGDRYSYKEVAEKCGSPNAYRAVGTACANNILCLLIPCHRVVKNDGSVNNYVYGSKIKKSLLDLERNNK